MLRSAANLGERSPGSGRTALHWACARGDVPMIQALARMHGIDFNAFDTNGCTPLMCAVAAGNGEAVKRLLLTALVNAAPAGRAPLNPSLCRGDALHQSPAALALAAPAADVLHSLLSVITFHESREQGLAGWGGAGPGTTAGFASPAGARRQSTRRLGCRVNTLLQQPVDAAGRPPLLAALRLAQGDPSKLAHTAVLLEQGAPIVALEPSAGPGLPKSGPPPGASPLHLLLPLLARLRAERQAARASGDDDGRTVDCRAGIEVLSAQLHGNGGNGSGDSTMSTVAAGKLEAAAAAAAQDGAPQDDEDYSDLSLAEYALQLMLQHPHLPEALGLQDSEGDTPLHVAATLGLADVVDALARDADLDVCNAAGHTPGISARQAGQQNCAEIIHHHRQVAGSQGLRRMWSMPSARRKSVTGLAAGCMGMGPGFPAQGVTVAPLHRLADSLLPAAPNGQPSSSATVVGLQRSMLRQDGLDAGVAGSQRASTPWKALRSLLRRD